MLLGKTQLPDWFSHGVKEKSLLFSCKLDELASDSGLLMLKNVHMQLESRMIRIKCT